MRTIHYVAGLPRSGSTLFCNILNQNPRFQATGSSGLLHAVTAVRDVFESVFGHSTLQSDLWKSIAPFAAFWKG